MDQRAPHLDLQAIARQAMQTAGFTVEFPPDTLANLHATRAPVASAGDLRTLLWSSIDNPTSRDLDQIEFVEQLPNGDARVRIGIADVDAFVPKGSPADLRAAQNGISVYLGVVTFPLFPPELSNDLTSLVQDQDRAAVVIDFTIAADGKPVETVVSLATVRNRAQLRYDTAGSWLENRGPAPQRVSEIPELAAQLKLQNEVAQRIAAERARSGALEFESIEPQPVMSGQQISSLELDQKNAARDLIENFMVAANSAIALFLEGRGSPSIQRIVRTPERWPRIVALAAEHGTQLPAEANAPALSAFLAESRRQHPDTFPELSLAIVKLIGAGEYVVIRNASEAQGHFGLAIHDYTHATAPNRRYPDLITQRLLKAAIAGASPPYTGDELEQIVARCNDRAQAARKIERFMRKVAAAAFLRNRIGETFDAIVTGVSPKGTYVRLTSPPAEGRLMRGEAGLDVGDKLRVRLLGTVPERGFIDFARA